MSIFSLATLLLFLALPFWGIRKVLAAAPKMRWPIFGFSLAGAASGALIAFALPARVVPDTPGSPAALVGYTLFWIAGGALLLVSLPAFAATLFPSRRR
jgi:hypothetical protein